MNLGHEGKLQEWKEFILLTNQSRTSHKNYLLSQAIAQASPALQIGDNDADSENSFVHWCESLWVDVIIMLLHVAHGSHQYVQCQMQVLPLLLLKENWKSNMLLLLLLIH